MCGVAGIFYRHSVDEFRMNVEARRQEALILHRGPDSSAVWSDCSAGISLVHTRLAIQDLSDAGSQPMHSVNKRFVIAYNGEVYNSAELRKEIFSGKHRFRGYSDTETILEGCASVGVEATVSKLIGMFAFALWDRKDQRICLVRDRLGIKPLYWTITSDGLLLFGSVLKAIIAHPECPKEVDRSSITGYMRHNYIGSNRTVYRNIQQLAPGHILIFSANMSKPEIKPYWDLGQCFERDASGVVGLTDDEAVNSLELLLRDAVAKRMITDVPLGAFLSGGIDSSLVAALMQSQHDSPVKTFSIGFESSAHNEAKYASEVAKHLGTEHMELYVTADDALNVIPNLPDMFDEPFADSSQIPTYLLSSLTRNHVTIALSGDGGDELFGGYERYLTALRIDQTLGKIPAPLRRLLASAMTSLSPDCWDSISHFLPQGWRPFNVGDRAHKLASMLRGEPDDIYRSLVSHWHNPSDIVICGEELQGAFWDRTLQARIPDFLTRMQYLDSATYLPGDILTKVDRTSMYDALEARVPLLDHRVVEFAALLPNHMKVRNGQGKWILRQILEKYVPKHLFDRPKMGFGVPLDTWLRGPLRDWAEDLLSKENFERHNLLRREPVMEKWRQHVSGQANWQYHIWDVLMLHAWANRYL